MDEKIMWVETLWNPLNDMKSSLMENKESEIKVAAYCRISPGASTYTHSLINQINYFTLLIKSKMNWKFSGIYFDKGISGGNYRNRPSFKRLLRHAKEGRIDYIITKSVSRFSRNSKELMEIVNELKELNVGVFFEKENIDTLKGYNGFLLSTYAALAQQEIENLSNSTRWGFEKRFIKGIPFFGQLLGYKVTDNHGNPEVRIIESEAEVVREVYDMYLNGLSLKEIAQELMSRGIKTAYDGELWNSNNVKGILTNITYAGHKLAGARMKDLLTGFNVPSDKFRTQYFIERSHPPIVSSEVFNLVQKKLEEANSRKYSGYSTRTERPLSKRIICGLCGRKYQSHPKNGGCSWECRTRIASKELCDTKTLNEKVLRNMLLKAFEERFDFKDSNIIKHLLKIIKTINRNDHFEFHRLKYLTEIELAIKKQLPDAQIQEIEQEYQKFEEKIIKIEDDRKYRDIAIEWMKEIKSIGEFIESVTIEHMRAWVVETTIYSKDDYIINWIDDNQTVIGDCSRREIKKTTTERILNARKENSVIIDVEGDRLSVQDYKNIHEGDNNLKTTKEVLKIEPGDSIAIIKDIKKNLSNFKVKSGHNNSKAKIRTVSYCRISSSSEEQKLSLKTQVAYYIYRILKDPEYEFGGIYVDEGISGTSTKNRTDFLRLIEDCKAGKVDLILTKSISRFARNTLDCLKYIKELKEYGTNVYFEKENIHTADEKSQFMISIMGSLAQEESVTMGSAIRWGKKRLAERGIVNPGMVNYGYRYGKDNEWIIVEEEAAVVKRIYKEFLEGKTFSQIARELTKDENIKSPTGIDTWSETTVKAILTNEVYRGNFLYHKSYTKQTIDNLVVKNKGELPMYLIENHHEPIVSSEDWEKVRAIHANRLKMLEDSVKKRYPKNNGKNEAFNKKFYCGECGGLIGYKRHIQSRSKQQTFSWRCNVSEKSSDVDKCKARFIRQEYIELDFMNMLIDIKDNSKFKDYLDKVLSDLELTSEELNMEEAIEARMKNLNQQLYEAVDQELNKKGQDSKKVDELTEEIVNLRNKLKVLQDRKEKINTIKSELNWVNKQVKDISKDEALSYKIPFNKDIFSRAVKNGVIFDDGKIIFVFNCGIEWSIPLRYVDYENFLTVREAAGRAAKKEEFLKGKEVRNLMKFCEEPRTLVEMMAFLNRYKSKKGLIRAIVNPLMEKGKLERKVDKNCKVLQYLYYTVK